ncbi:MAG TPA: IS110 family transposase [Gaiellaceae bacterium]|jgi:transposase
MRWVGLDVHARETTGVVLDVATGAVETCRLVGRAGRVLGWLERLERPFVAVYEAGPTGYGLARAAAAGGLDVRVCAPGHIVRNASDRVKTDQRDALRLARLCSAGELRYVRVPPLQEEQLRDLVRAREDVRVDLMRARHRLSKFLLRRECYYPHPGRAWTGRHREWLRTLVFADRASELTYCDLLEALDLLLSRRDRLERALAELAADSGWAETIGRLRCLRGIETLSAVGLCAEVGDFQRFAKPAKLSGFLGLVPSESTSGERRRQGAITKAGSRHARRLLVEAAWHYRRPPRVSAALAKRQHGQDARVIQIAWRAQRRLHQRWQGLETTRSKPAPVVAVAVARELATYVWEIATLG